MNKWFNYVLRSQIATAIMCVILGGFLIGMPDEILKVASTLFSVILICLGGIRIFMYMKDRDNGMMFSLLLGVLLVIIGCYLLSNPKIFGSILPIVLGAIILVDSLWTFDASIQMRRAGFARWPFMFVSSLVCVVLAVIMIVNPFKTMTIVVQFAGAVYLCNGIIDLIFILIMRNSAKILEKSTNVVVRETEAARRDGEILDAEVDASGRVIVEGSESDEDSNVIDM